LAGRRPQIAEIAMSEPKLYTSRRQFLAGSINMLSLAGTMPVFLGRTAFALAGDPPKAAKDEAAKILVMIQLAGGNDGLNTIIPVDRDEYYKARPRIAIAKKDALALRDGFALHPAADGLKTLFDEGHVAVIHGVGYPNPDRSHFVSTDIWLSADPERRTSSGWLGRYFDACCGGSDPGPSPKAIDAISLTQEVPLALQGEQFSPLAFNDPNSLAWHPGQKDAEAQNVFRKLNNVEASMPETDGELQQFLQRAALEAQIGADQIRSAAGDVRGMRQRRAPRGQLGEQLRLVSRLIAKDLPTRVYYVSMGGFDTHSGQLGRHQQLINQFSDAVHDFVLDLKDDGLLDRVLIVAFSEFGRRVQENGSGGTDHGEAAPMFIFGGKVRPGLHGKHPALEDLRRGDLKFTTDFRRVYASVLKDWFDMAPTKVLKGGYEPMKLLRA
jgi:uncharacterized protein (DUF1501 family)